jgi:integrase
LNLRNTGTTGTDKLRSFSSGTLGSKMGGSLPMLVRKILVKGTVQELLGHRDVSTTIIYTHEYWITVDFVFGFTIDLDIPPR